MNENSPNKYQNSDLKEYLNELPSDEILYEYSEVLKAISDPLRLKILYLLKNKELCACYINSTLNKPQSTISHHINILKKSKMLKWRKEGVWIYYSLMSPKIIDLIEKMINIQNDKKNTITNSNINTKEFKVTENEINENLLKNFENKAKKLNIKSIGYTKINLEKINREKSFKYSNAIVLTIEINEEIINKSPGKKAKELNSALYKKFKKITYELSDYLINNGFKTEIAIPNEKGIDLPFLGQKSGLGYIGKSGLLITPKLGPKLKISAILTNIENLPFSKNNEHIWIEDYCEKCDECVKSCEKKALNEKEDNEPHLIAEECIGSTEGCTYCIEKCPFYTEGYHKIKKEYYKQ